MKFLVLCYKLPYPLSKSRAANHYKTIQGEKSHNQDGANPVYESEPTFIDEEGVTHCVSRIRA